MTASFGEFEIRRADVDEILPLREAVLIRGTTRVSPEFPGDRDRNTRHYGVFHGSRAVGCATFLPSEWEGGPAWQLRGMATDSDYRGRGVGRALLAFAESDLCGASEVRQLWCNARTGAVGFYERHGWRAVSEEFEIEGVGPHRRMVRRL